MQYIEKLEKRVDDLTRENEQLRDAKWNLECENEEWNDEVQSLNDEKESIIQDRDDNYIQKSVASQVEISDRDFV